MGLGLLAPLGSYYQGSTANQTILTNVPSLLLYYRPPHAPFLTRRNGQNSTRTVYQYLEQRSLGDDNARFESQQQLFCSTRLASSHGGAPCNSGRMLRGRFSYPLAPTNPAVVTQKSSRWQKEWPPITFASHATWFLQLQGSRFSVKAPG